MAIATPVISGQFILLTFHIIRRKYLLYAIHPQLNRKNKKERQKVKKEKKVLLL
jgi:hypothetical protein